VETKNMADGGITGMSLRGVRKLIDDKGIGDSVLDAVDDLLGAAFVLSPIVAGPAALPLLAMIEPKNELVKLALRIGVKENREQITLEILNVFGAVADRYHLSQHGLAILLMRLAREHDDHRLVNRLFAADGPIDWFSFFDGTGRGGLSELDVEEISIDLTYREAMDLRWTVDVLRQANGGQTGASGWLALASSRHNGNSSNNLR
jgi:hypothetical protein